MEKKELEKKIRKILRENLGHSEYTHNFPLFIISGGGEKKDVHVASNHEISNMFSFVGGGVDDIVYGTKERDGILYIMFGTNDFDNIDWQDYARLESFMKELETHYLSEDDPEIIDRWEINTVKRRIAIEFNKEDYEIIF